MCSMRKTEVMDLRCLDDVRWCFLFWLGGWVWVYLLRFMMKEEEGWQQKVRDVLRPRDRIGCLKVSRYRAATLLQARLSLILLLLLLLTTPLADAHRYVYTDTYTFQRCCAALLLHKQLDCMYIHDLIVYILFPYICGITSGDWYHCAWGEGKQTLQGW